MNTLQVLLFSSLILVSTVQDEKEVEVGEDATLDCQGPLEGNILRLAWTKSDLKEDDYVFFYREDRAYKSYQHKSFKGRVELGDPKMKRGNMSIILHNATVDDAGTYECHISYQSATDLGQRSEIKWETKLKVTPAVQRRGARKDGEATHGSVGLKAGLSVSGLLLIAAAAGFLVYRKHKQKKSCDLTRDPTVTFQNSVLILEVQEIIEYETCPELSPKASALGQG